MFGVFYRNYSLAVNSESDSRFLAKIFEHSKVLSDLNKSLLYFNLPFESILKDRHLPTQLFPPPNSDMKLPMISQVIDFFERKQAHLMPNVILM